LKRVPRHLALGSDGPADPQSTSLLTNWIAPRLQLKTIEQVRALMDVPPEQMDGRQLLVAGWFGGI
jgi:hypothetical protein